MFVIIVIFTFPVSTKTDPLHPSFLFFYHGCMHFKTVGNQLMVYLEENDKNAHVNLILVLIENLSKFKGKIRL